MGTSCNFSQVHLVQVQVPLGFASWYLHLALVDLIQSQWWGTSCNSNSSTPHSGLFGGVRGVVSIMAKGSKMTTICYIFLERY